MKRVAQRYNYSVTTLAPLHIGSGEVMAPLEYHIADDLIVPELDLIFAKYPDAAARFTELLSAMSGRELARTEMGELIDPAVFDDAAIRRYSITPFQNDAKKFDSLDKLSGEIKARQAEVRLFIKTPKHEPYIPGSSIKGALRTAWAYEQCKTGQNIYDAISGLAWQGYEKNADQRLTMQVFYSPAQKRERERREFRERDAAFDVFRVLQVGDSQPRPSDEVLLLVAERVLSANVGARTNGEPDDDRYPARFDDNWVFDEAIDEHFNFDGQIAFNESLLMDETAKRVMRWNQAQSELTLEKILQAVNRFAADLCQWEIEYFERIDDNPKRCDVIDVLSFYDELKTKIEEAPPDTCYFSLGRGSGWHKLTIGLLLEKRMRRDQFAEVRRRLNLAKNRIDFEYPKSRKLVMNGNNSAYSPFGWVKLKVTGENTEG